MKTKLSFKFPCLPWRGCYEVKNGHMDTLREMVGPCEKKEPVNWGTRRKPWIVGYKYGVEDAAKAAEIFQTLFGYDLLQAFYRTAKREGRAVNRNQRSMWCVPVADLEKIHFRYRATVWNHSETVPKNLQWLLEPIYSQWLDREKDAAEIQNPKEKHTFLREFRPDYSVLDLGPDRLPPVYVCNLCDFKAEKQEWPCGQLMPGFADNGILRCPSCGAKSGDMFERIANVVNGKKQFTPRLEWQDGFWFTL